SMPRAVPMKRISAPNCFFSCWAMARAGITWPPVPPPAMMMRMKFSCAFYGRVENRDIDLIGLTLSGRLVARMIRGRMIRDGGCASGVPPPPPHFLIKVFILKLVTRKVFILKLLTGSQLMDWSLESMVYAPSLLQSIYSK